MTNTHVAIGEVITPQMVSLEQWPKDRVPEGAITEWEQVADRRPHSAAITPMRGALSTSMGTPGSGDRVIAVDNVKNTDKTREDSDWTSA